MKWHEGSPNDYYLGDPPEWWVAFNREANAYYHIACKDKWENKLEVLNPIYESPECPHCKANVGEEMAMLMLLQRMKVKLPGPPNGGVDSGSA